MSSEDTATGSTMTVKFGGEKDNYWYLLKDDQGRYWLAVNPLGAEPTGGVMAHYQLEDQLSVVRSIPGGVILAGTRRPRPGEHMEVRAYELSDELASLLRGEKLAHPANQQSPTA